MRAVSERQGHNRARDRALFLTAGRTGLRAGELVRLRVEDVKLDARPVPFLWVSTLKRRRPLRDTVMLERSVCAELKSWIYRGLGVFHGLPASMPVTGRAILFPSESKRARRDPDVTDPMTTRNLSKVFRFYARRAGLPAEITLHGLRHFRAMTLYSKTGDLEFTRRELRHRSISSTGVYLHTRADQAREYLNKLERGK